MPSLTSPGTPRMYVHQKTVLPVWGWLLRAEDFLYSFCLGSYPGHPKSLVAAVTGRGQRKVHPDSQRCEYDNFTVLEVLYDTL